MTSNGTPSAGFLIAAGDSWLDYARWACDPAGKSDIVQELRGSGFQVTREAVRGTRIQDFAYSKTHLDRVMARIDEHVKAGKMPKAILLSGGGNDIVDQGVFIGLLNHAGPAQPCFNEQLITALIDGTIRDAYTHCLSTMNRLCSELPGLMRPVPILIHGYDYPVPDGRSHCLPFKFPWLGPAFHKRGYTDLEVRRDSARYLITRLNTMLSRLAELPEFANVQYVGLQGTLSTELTKSEYRQHWENELHPTKKGWTLLAGKFKHMLDRLESPSQAAASSS